MDTLEYIEDYFKGRLSEEQKAEFDQRIRTDPDFSAQTAFYISTMEVLTEEVAAEKKTRFRTLYEESKTRSIGHAPVRRIWPWLAAASVLVLVAGIWWISTRSPGPEKLADDYIRQELTTLPVNMSSVQDSLQKAISLYNKEQFPEALQQFQQIRQKDPGAIRAGIYAGIVYLRLKEYDKALNYFQQLATDTTLNSNPALFYESLTLMKLHRPGDDLIARQLLQEVVDRNLAKKEDALQLLKNW